MSQRSRAPHGITTQWRRGMVGKRCGSLMGARAQTVGEQGRVLRRRLNHSDFEAHGDTIGFAGCRAIIRWISPRPHSTACRTRVEQLLHGLEGGLRRNNLPAQATHQKLAEKIEESDRKRTTTLQKASGIPALVALGRRRSARNHLASIGG